MRSLPTLALLATLAVAASIPALTGSSQAVAPSGPDVAAVIDGRTVTVAELDLVAGPDQIELRQLEYESRKKALDFLLHRALIEKEAAARGIEPRELIAAEVMAKLTGPTPEAVEAFKKANPRLDAGDLEESEWNARIVLALERQQREAVENAFIDGLLRSHASSYQVHLSRPRVELTDQGAPVRGPASAAVTIVLFSDYECEGCRKADRAIHELMESFPGQVRLVRRDFPAARHEHAARAAVAARCAGEQGRYWPFHDALMADRTRLPQDGLLFTADELGLDADAFQSCLQGESVVEAVVRDRELGQALGLQGTPSAFVNGIPVPELLESDWLPKLVESELGLAGR